MTSAPDLMPVFVKEVRALAPALLKCIAAVWLVAFFAAPDTLRLVLAAYVIGATILGALSIGHEYTFKTLQDYLTQPIPRTRLLAVKAGSLAMCLAVLWGMAAAAIDPLSLGHLTTDMVSLGRGLLVVPTLLALCLAPWLTMVCRSPMAGAVFTLAIPAVIWIGGETVAVARYGLVDQSTSQFETLKLTFLEWASPVLVVGGALMTWRTFMRLEAIDGAGDAVNLPRVGALWSSRAAAAGVTVRSRTLALIAKELRLQQMSFVVAALYSLVVGAVLVARYFVPTFLGPTLGVVTEFYSLLLAALIGSLASASERQLGVHEWQLLQPVSSGWQWMLKCGVGLGLVALLVVGLPHVLDLFAPAGSLDSVVDRRVNAIVYVAVAICALYVSSISKDGLRAFVTAVPVILAGALLTAVIFGAVMAVVSSWTGRLLIQTFGPPHGSIRHSIDLRWMIAAWLTMTSVAGLLLRFGLSNHRASSGSARAIRTQFLWIGLSLTSACVVYSALRVVIGYTLR